MSDATEALLHEHREGALTCYDHAGYCCVCGEHDTPSFRKHLAAVIDDKVGVSELMNWLTENTNEWALEVNPHEGVYTTRERYVRDVDKELWHDGQIGRAHV